MNFLSFRLPKLITIHNMKKFFSICVVSLLICISLRAQKKVNDFTVTDISGKKHSLYSDYLDKGKVVMTILFINDCDPCINISPRIQSIYEKYGSGLGNLQIIAMNIFPDDTLEGVKKFVEKAKAKYPHVSKEGASLTASLPFRNNTYGIYQGIPQFSIITPGRDILFEVVPNRFEERIDEVLKSSSTLPNVVTVGFGLQNAQTSSLPSGASLFLRSKKDGAYVRNITTLTNGTHSFEYPSQSFPAIDEPFIEFSAGSALPGNTVITVSDLVALRNHILGIENLPNEKLPLADTNGDEKVNVLDVLELQRFILKLDAKWRNQNALLMNPSIIPISVSGSAQRVNINANLTWMGNLVD
jgi:peroxiredoxin